MNIVSFSHVEGDFADIPSAGMSSSRTGNRRLPPWEYVAQSHLLALLRCSGEQARSPSYFSLLTFHFSLFTFHFSLFTFHFSLAKRKIPSSLPSDAAKPFIQRDFAIFISPFIPPISLPYPSYISPVGSCIRIYRLSISTYFVTGEIWERYGRDKNYLSRPETPLYKGISEDDGRDGGYFV